MLRILLSARTIGKAIIHPIVNYGAMMDEYYYCAVHKSSFLTFSIKLLMALLQKKTFNQNQAYKKILVIRLSLRNGWKELVFNKANNFYLPKINLENKSDSIANLC